MEPRDDSADGSMNTIGCGLLTLVGGLLILSLYFFDLGTGRGPIGAGAALLFGALLIFLGLYRFAMALISRRKDR